MLGTPQDFQYRYLFMLIRLGYDIRFQTISRVPFIALLNVHPSRRRDLREPDVYKTDPQIAVSEYEDSFGNSCTRFVAPPGDLRIYNSFLVEDSGIPDAVKEDAQQAPIEDLPPRRVAVLAG